jgi:GNAT superfamily N-acetyltransferase
MPARAMRLTLVVATPGDAAEVAALHAAVAERLTAEFGAGHWSSAPSERGVLAGMRRSTVYLARRRGRTIGTLALSTRKPWAIDKAYFAPAARPLYLTSMAVDPELQRNGIGRHCIVEAVRLARAWPADAIRLDAYDAAAGAGRFYAKCGFREVGRVVYRKNPLVYYELLL